MSGILINKYKIGNVNFDSLMLSLDKQRRGISNISISNMDNTSAPVIEAGSSVEVGGALYEFTTDKSISTTDPYTDEKIEDGFAYIILISSGSPSVINAYFTATNPVWRTDYHGHYKDSTIYKYIGGCSIDGNTTIFNSKFIYNNRDASKGKTKLLIHKSVVGPISGAEKPLIYDTISFDSKREYNSTTGVFTVETNGYYRVNAYTSFYTNSAGSIISCKSDINVNGTSKACSYHNGKGQYLNFSISLPLSTLLYLTRGDKITIETNTTDGTWRTATTIGNYLSINEI